MKLAPGEASQPLRICSRKPWNPTGIELVAGQRYRFEAQGEWIDLTIHSRAGGYATQEASALSRRFLKIFESSRRMPTEKWFALVGTVGRDESTVFVIGERREDWPAPADGELHCFANDVRWAYFNNRGSVSLTVTRVA